MNNGGRFVLRAVRDAHHLGPSKLPVDGAHGRPPHDLHSEGCGCCAKRTSLRQLLPPDQANVGATKCWCVHGMRIGGARGPGTRGLAALNPDMLCTSKPSYLLLQSWPGLGAFPKLFLWLRGRFIINSLSYSRTIERRRQDSSRFNL